MKVKSFDFVKVLMHDKSCPDGWETSYTVSGYNSEIDGTLVFRYEDSEELRECEPFDWMTNGKWIEAKSTFDETGEYTDTVFEAYVSTDEWLQVKEKYFKTKQQAEE